MKNIKLIKLSIGLSAILMILIFCFFHHAKNNDISVLENNRKQLELDNEKIVAPAVVDSAKDVTRIVALQSGIVKQTFVFVGGFVKKGDTLALLDDTAAKNNLHIQSNAHLQALNALNMQQKQLVNAELRFKRIQRIDPRAISKSEKQDRWHDVVINQLQVNQMKLNLANAKINLEQTERSLSEFAIKAPIDGIVLQINAHVGDYIGGGQPVILLGDADKVYVRVSIDERDIHRFRKDAHAVITSTDGSQIAIPLVFSELDRYIVVPDYLNTRCQEAKYYFKRSDYPSVVAGQQFETTITAPTAG